MLEKSNEAMKVAIDKMEGKLKEAEAKLKEKHIWKTTSHRFEGLTDSPDLKGMNDLLV
jgi:hypothetical protein